MSPAKKKKATGAKVKTAMPAKGKQSRVAPGLAAAQKKIDVLIWLRAKKGKEAPLEQELRTLEAASRAESGCEAFVLHIAAEQPGNFFLHEIWSSEAALAAHRLTPHFQCWFGLQSATLESRRRYIAE